MREREVCVCVCVRERERGRVGERVTEGERKRGEEKWMKKNQIFSLRRNFSSSSFDEEDCVDGRHPRHLIHRRPEVEWTFSS